MTTFTISLLLLLFLEVSVLLKVEVYLLTDSARTRLEMVNRIHGTIPTLCVLETMSARNNQTCGAVSSHTLPPYERLLTRVRTTCTSPHERRCICRTALSGKCLLSTPVSLWRFHIRLYRRCTGFSCFLFLNGGISVTEVNSEEDRTHAST